MTQQERHGWFIVASLFVILLLVFGGGYNTVPVLLPALLKGFPHWSHQRVSILPSVLAASAGVSVLPVGWLVDRIEARIVMAIGALTLWRRLYHCEPIQFARSYDRRLPARWYRYRRGHRVAGRARPGQLVHRSARDGDGDRQCRFDHRRNGDDPGRGLRHSPLGMARLISPSGCRCL
jgi:hypothetical protein